MAEQLPQIDFLKDALRQFDRKERFYLVQNCLGEAADKVGNDFASLVSNALHPQCRVDPAAWWTTDYHLDWLAGALALCYCPKLLENHLTVSWVNGIGTEPGHQLVMGSQEDADLVIADKTRLILIEAKRFGRWQKAQVITKLNRLRTLKLYNDKLSQSNPGRPKIEIFMLFASPGKSSKPPGGLEKIWQDYCNGIEMTTLSWIPLKSVDGDKRKHALMTRRCRPIVSSNTGSKSAKPKQDKSGTHWFIDRVRITPAIDPNT